MGQHVLALIDGYAPKGFNEVVRVFRRLH